MPREANYLALELGTEDETAAGLLTINWAAVSQNHSGAFIMFLMGFWRGFDIKSLLNAVSLIFEIDKSDW